MSKGLVSYPEDKRTVVALRRASNSLRGNGFYGALDYLAKKGIKAPEKAGQIFKRQEKEGIEHAIPDDGNTATRIGRHPGSIRDSGNSGSKPQRRGGRSNNRKPNDTQTPGLEMSTMRRDVPTVERGFEPPKTAQTFSSRYTPGDTSAHFGPPPRRQTFKPQPGYKLKDAWPKGQ